MKPTLPSRRQPGLRRFQVGKAAPKAGKPPAIVLINPKTAFNAGMVVRLASAYGISQVWYTGTRVDDDIRRLGRIPREERIKGYKDVSIINYEYPLEQFDGATPVAIEVRENSVPLHLFQHTEDAVYVFGPEDGSIPRSVLVECHRFVVIPTRHCLNLATAVSTVLWDRTCKRYGSGLCDPAEYLTPGDYEARGLAENDPTEIFG
jgi:tRNA(Leu) C34 or U34 (ribose-2'-O)-methylase TrmL